MRKKRLLYIMHDLALGGVEVALLSAVPRLHLEFDLKIVCLGKIDPTMITALSPDEKAAFSSFEQSPPLFLISIFSAIRFILRFNPDIMICSLWRASMIGVIIKKIKRNIKLVSFIHSTTFFHTLDRIFTTLAIKNADIVFTDSKATKDYIVSSFRNELPIKTVSFLKNLPPDKKLNARLNIDSEVKFIYLGRIHPVKNIPLAIDTIHFLRTRGIQATLDIFGKPSKHLLEIEKHIQAMHLQSFVHFKGELWKIPQKEIFKEYNFLIQLSKVEGMAMSVAEAMQNGIVCVVTPVGEIPNYSVNMKSAIFMNYQTPHDWNESLNQLESVIRSPELYDTISYSCWQNFQAMQSYSDSLVECILMID